MNEPILVSGASRSRFALVKPHFAYLLLALLALTGSRLGLIAWQWSRVETLGTAARVLGNGVRMDLILISYTLALPLLFSLAFAGHRYAARTVATGLRVYFVAMLALIVYFEILTVPFIREFDTRPNRLFLEYLVHPQEVATMLWRGYQPEIATTVLLTTVAVLVAWKAFGRWLKDAPRVGLAARLAMLVVGAPLLFLGARSSLAHRPANPSSVAFSQDHLLNDLCLASAYSVAHAAEGLLDEVETSFAYGRLEDDDAVFDELKSALVTVPADAYVSDELPTLHRQRATSRRERPLNLVIVLEESLGAQYVGELGGRPVTRFIDTLADEGWWFERMYATGTRSVRGIEAVVTGFPPTPARAVVKLGLAQQGFFTLADLLGRAGYETQFVYGGESHFDNMKRFFTGNGFEHIVDRDDFESPTFEGSWGVCDGDIFAKAHETFLAFGDQPFFSVVFTVSNHSPWEFPLVPGLPARLATNEDAVRYADHALGDFFAAARNAPYWDNTVFVVVADHDSRVYGASLVPIEHFHIPAVIVGPGIAARREARITSQIDLGPTLLSLIGVDSEHPMPGFDLTRLPADHPGRAIMQYGANHAYMAGDDVVVHQPRLGASQYTWDGVGLTPEELDPQLARRALAHALAPTLLYRERRYRLTDESAEVAIVRR